MTAHRRCRCRSTPARGRLTGAVDRAARITQSCATEAVSREEKRHMLDRVVEYCETSHESPLPRPEPLTSLVPGSCSCLSH